ncbi:MAG: archaetidylserine decarboxylase [Granulosicoccaceae bacterium]
MATARDWLKSTPLYILPHHWVSRVVYWATRQQAKWVPSVIKWFVRTYNVDMSQAQHSDINHYPTFNAFFTRSLKDGARPACDHDSDIASPADGRISAIGNIENGTVYQAKGRDYSLLELLGGDTEAAAKLANGRFVTVYLSPRDYHRLHMPLTGKLLNQTHVPGRLFSVAPHTVNTVPRLFARNERVIAQFDTNAGLMALVLVGAINVAAIETVWSGLVTPPQKKHINRIDYTGDEQVSLRRGEEMGRFNMGSTIIVLLENPARWRLDMQNGDSLNMGQLLGHIADRTVA